MSIFHLLSPKWVFKSYFGIRICHKLLFGSQETNVNGLVWKSIFWCNLSISKDMLKKFTFFLTWTIIWPKRRITVTSAWLQTFQSWRISLRVLLMETDPVFQKSQAELTNEHYGHWYVGQCPLNSLSKKKYVGLSFKPGRINQWNAFIYLGSKEPYDHWKP